MYSASGYKRFHYMLCYKGYVIKEYFANYFLHMSDITFDMSTNTMEVHTEKEPKSGKLHWLSTGEHTMTGGGVKELLTTSTMMFSVLLMVMEYFLNIAESIEFHKVTVRKLH